MSSTECNQAIIKASNIYEDGILLAEDIMGMELSTTELVVLSACNTGIGRVKNGEGVYGLRRALFLAGAKTLIMTMWNVSDVATMLLMCRFYENLKTGKCTRLEALREAQNYIRNLTAHQLKTEWLLTNKIKEPKEIAEIQKYTQGLSPGTKCFSHPFFWGGFICQGEYKKLKNKI